MANEILLSNIREMCKRHNITVTLLEKELDIGAGTISRWNKANPSIDRVMAIARFFEVSIDALVGYEVRKGGSRRVDGQTEQIIEYLTNMTKQVGERESFWHDYHIDDAFGLKISKVQEQCGEGARILYACDDTGSYLLAVSYVLSECYEYEMECRLYLIPDENDEPVLECEEKEALHILVIEALNKLKIIKNNSELKEKAARQRERIMKKMQ